MWSWCSRKETTGLPKFMGKGTESQKQCNIFLRNVNLALRCPEFELCYNTTTMPHNTIREQKYLGSQVPRTVQSLQSFPLKPAFSDLYTICRWYSAVSSRCHFCPPLLALLKANGSQRYHHCFPVLERKLCHVQKLCIWPPGWKRALRISLMLNYFWIELKTWTGMFRFCWKSSSAGYGLLK